MFVGHKKEKEEDKKKKKKKEEEKMEGDKCAQIVMVSGC